MQHDMRTRFRGLKCGLASGKARSYDLNYLQTLF